MMKLMMKMMNCEKYSKLVSKRIDSKLSLSEKFSLNFHLMMCKACSLFENESKVIDTAMKKSCQISAEMSAERKQAIQKTLQAK